MTEKRRYFTCKNEGCDNETKPPYKRSPPRTGYYHYTVCQSCTNTMRVYGITHPEKVAMVEAQDYKCKLCNIDLVMQRSNSNTACVDHCHSTGAIRGILCLQCNSAIGKLGDTEEALTRVVAYIKGEL